MWYFELIMLLAVGILCCSMGWRIWKKEKITLIHDYHYKNVKESDKKAYTSLMGKALLIMGIGIALTGMVNFGTHSGCGWFAFGISFVLSLVIITYAQYKYNHGIF